MTNKQITIYAVTGLLFAALFWWIISNEARVDRNAIPNMPNTVEVEIR